MRTFPFDFSPFPPRPGNGQRETVSKVVLPSDYFTASFATRTVSEVQHDNKRLQEESSLRILHLGVYVLSVQDQLET